MTRSSGKPAEPRKSAVEVLKDVAKLQSQKTRERREYEKARSLLEDYEDLRDEVMSIVRNSGLSHEDIHERFGPHPHTLEAWAERRIRMPRLGKLRSTLKICGYDIGIVDKRGKGLGDSGGAA